MVLSVNITFVKFSSVVPNTSWRFFVIALQCSTVWMCCHLYIQSPGDGRLDCFQFSTLVTKAEVRTRVQVFLWICVFISFLYRSGIAGPYGKLLSYHPRNCLTVLHSGWTILHSHQQTLRIPVAPHPHQHLQQSFWFQPSWWCEVASHCGLGLHFPNDYWHEASFHTLISILYIFLEEIAI